MNKISRTTLLLTVLLLLPCRLIAQDFGDYFIDQTLRLDYIFSGNASTQDISLLAYYKIPGWYGKRHRLAETPMKGNGTITVRDLATGRVIYKHPFSSLFQEWLSYPQAQESGRRAFENVSLIPMPKQPVEVSLELRNSRHDVIASMTHRIDPNDILMTPLGEQGIMPYTTLQAPKDSSRAIHIAFVAEGYTEDEMEDYLADARKAVESIFGHEPFKSLRDRFSIIAVRSPSAESGASIPSKEIWRDTALGSHFDTFYSERYLTTLHLRKLHDLLAGTPYEHIIVLVNTPHYGGGGILNSYNLSMTKHPAFVPVVTHEFGHSFAGLADEYAYEAEQIPMYPTDVEPWEQNITTLKEFSAKWVDLLPAEVSTIPTPEECNYPVGVYEGAGYSLKGVYRPSKDCRMRTNTNPEFCPVCQRAIREVINFYTD
ncbi:M64 family metallopeptidase [uncultured Porphyromonas sp.]|uniref:M64 family metallopeptidase n=1 Tax=uncultured Porphyromonas sp. TaxID=159274 RepID=UPI0025E8CB47|nr:M64 family metallopeptidase [uncultured Porphyromonas sp.]